MADPVNCNGLSIGSGQTPDIPQMSDLCLYSPTFRELPFSELGKAPAQLPECYSLGSLRPRTVEV